MTHQLTAPQTDPEHAPVTYDLSAAITLETVTPDDILRETYDLNPAEAGPAAQKLSWWAAAYGAADLEIEYQPDRLTARVAPAHVHDPRDVFSRASLRISTVTHQPHTYVPDDQPGNEPLCQLILRCTQGLTNPASPPSTDDLIRLLVRTLRADPERYDTPAAQHLSGPLLDAINSMHECQQPSPAAYRQARRHAANLYALANPHETTFSYSGAELLAALEHDAAATGHPLPAHVAQAVIDAMTTCPRRLWAELLGTDDAAQQHTPAAQLLQSAALTAGLDTSGALLIKTNLRSLLLINMENKNRLEQERGGP